MKFRNIIAGLASATLMLASPALSLAEDGVSADTIKIGMYGPITGTTSIGGLALYGAAAIYRHVNDQGGIHGRKIELIIEDDACNTSKALSIVKKFISSDRVFLAHGGWCSAGVMALKPMLAENSTFPFVDLAGASTDIAVPVMPNLYQPIPNAETVTRTMLELALTKPDIKRIAIIGHSNEWADSHIKPLLAMMEEKGLEPVKIVKLESGETNATPQVLTLRQAKPDAVMAILYPPELTLYLKEAYKYGVKAPIFTTQGVSIEDMVKQVGNKAATGNLFVFYPLNGTMDDPDMKKWLDIFARYYPDEPLETLSLTSMTGSLAVVEALKNAGPDLTREKFIAEMDKLTDFDPGIESGALTFTPDNHAGIKSGKMIYWPAHSDRTLIVSEFPAE